MSKRLIEEVRRAVGGGTTTERMVKDVADAVFGAVQKLTNEGERVTIRGFGTFQKKLRNERTARNPRTGETVKVAARHALVFKEAKDNS